MSEKLIKPYEISVWEDTLVKVPDTEPAQYKFEEKKLAVIGSDTMTGLNKIYNPVFHKKANGERTLEFSMKYKYFDPYSGNEGVINPFVALLTNERKVKLHYDNEWYEFIVKEHTESSEEYEWTYECTDAFVLELSKNGYNLTFDNELNNNQGTAAELAEKVLEGTDWQLGQPDLFKQLVEEPIYLAELNTDSGIEIINATGDGAEIPTAPCDIYLFYTYVKNKNGKYVQFIIRDENRQYVIDDKNVITDTNYRITTDLIYKDDGFYLNESDANPVISWEGIETKYQAYRLVYNQLTTYDPVMERTVDRFVIDGEDREVYRYIDYIYTTSNVVLNYITNGDNFNVLEDGTLQGWNPYVDFTGSDEKIDKLELVTKPELEPGKVLADISTLSQIEGFLKVKFKNAYTEGKNAVFNSGFADNTSSIQSISQGDRFVFRWRAGQRDSTISEYEYALTKDKIIDEEKEYYIRSGEEGAYIYTIVTDFTELIECEETFEELLEESTEILNNTPENETTITLEWIDPIKETTINETFTAGTAETKIIELDTLLDELDETIIINVTISYNGDKTFTFHWDDALYIPTSIETTYYSYVNKIPKDEGWYEEVESSISDVDCLVSSPNLRMIIAKYTQDEPNRWSYYYKHIDTNNIILNFDLSEGQDTPEILNNIIEGGTFQDYYSLTTDRELKEGKTYYTYDSETETYVMVSTPDPTQISSYYELHNQYVIDDVVQTPSTKYIYIDNTDEREYVWNGLTGNFELKTENNYLPYYYLTATATKALPYSVLKDPTQKYGIFIYTNDSISSQKPFYIEDIQLTRLIEDAEGKPIIMGNIPTALSSSTEYYYIQPADGTAAEDVIMYTSLDELKNSIGVSTNIIPLYNENSEKNLTISASQSNRFDILQTIAETFECWIDLQVQHEDNGAISYVDNVPQKYVYLREYAGDKQWAGFKYGINLQSIERQINSEEFVTKLIVDQSQSEYVDEGYVSIASAPSNTSGESYILNFDYYYNQGLLNREEAEIDRLNFITEVQEVNQNLQDKEQLCRNLEASMTALGSKRNVYTELIDTAKETKSQSLAEFEDLTNRTYDEYREQQDNAIIYDGDYYVPTNDTTVKDGKIYYIYDEQEEEITPVETIDPSDNPHDNNWYELLMDLTEEDTVFSLIGEIYVSSATINNYSGILTNIDQEYWNVRRQLRGLETYNVKVWVGQDDLEHYHVFVELNDYLPDFTFTLAGVEYESTVSVKHFDIEFENIDNLTINFSAPSNYHMSETSYLIDKDVVKTILIEPNIEQTGVEAEVKRLREEKNTIVNEFNNKYSRFIKEGTWNSNDYIDSELYYLDALQVSNTSAQPTVSYTINVVEISQLEGFEWYLFDAGDKSYVEDTEFFGWHIDNVGTEQNPELVYTPAREEVIVSEVEWHLEEPDKNVITVQNYKTRFEDFFQRVSATVQTVQYNEASYAKITNLLDPNGTLNQNVLLESMNRLAGQKYALTSDGSVNIDGDNILIQNLTNPANRVIINSEGIRVSDDGGINWTTAIDGQGINIGTVYTGTLNTNEVIIGSREYPSFRWDKSGISAYHVDQSDVPDVYILTEDTEVILGKIYYILVRSGYRPVENPTGNPKAQGWYELETENFTDLKTFVRFDEYGLYGIKNADKFKAEQLSDILDKAHFAVTWDGFFIKNSYADGGRVSITSDNDFQVTKKINGNEQEVIKIGMLEQRANGNLYGMRIKGDNNTDALVADSDGNLSITGIINATGGNFNDIVTVGRNTAQTSDYIIINGETASISSSNYNGGPSTSATQGWIINKDGDAVFNNITARGSIKTAVFEYAEIQAVGGVFIFRPSSAIRSAAVDGNNLVVTVEKQYLFNVNDWVKISNYTTDGTEPEASSAISAAGLYHIYKVSAINGRVITLEGAAAMVEGASAIATVDDLVGGALVSMGNYNTQTGINSNNYGIGINSSDNTVNLPARAISLFETTVQPENSQKIIYNYRGILGTLPPNLNGVNTSIYNHMQGTQGIYTDNMYLGDANQYLAFYTDGNNDKHLRISTKELIYELGTGQGGSDITWEDYIDEKIEEASSNQHFWFSATPTSSYVLTKDIEVDSEKTYYVRSGSIGNYIYTVVTPEEGDNPLEEGWYEAALIPAGAYITNIDVDLFKEDPANNANIVTRNDGVYLKKGLDTLAAFEHSGLRFYNPATLEKSIELNSDGLALYAPNKTNASATLTSNGLTITDGSIILSNDRQLDSIALSNVSFTREINDIEREDLRLAIGNNFGVKNDGTLYANNIIATGGNIGGAEINNGILQIGESQIIDGAITSNKIEAEAITSNKIEAGAITSNKIEAGAITVDKLAIGTYIQFLYVPTLLTAQPNDWTTNWTKYYEKDTTHGLQADEYRHVEGDSAPIWEQNKYYEEKNENPRLLMGNKEKVAVTIDISQDINNGQMTFWQNWQPVAYINNNRMTIPESVMLREMMVGQDKWSWREHDGNLQLKWIGD